MSNIIIVLALVLVGLIVFIVLFENEKMRLHREKLRVMEDERIKSSFLTHIGQAVRMPLNSINMICNKLDDPDKEGLTIEDYKNAISRIHRNSHQMYTYLNELMELTNFNGAVPALAMIEVNLAELILSYRREILHEVRRGVMVGVSSTMSPHCKATMDTTIFRQLIMNLLRIAAQRTMQGSITIRYNWECEGLRFWIEDTGEKFPDSVRGLLFTELLTDDYTIKEECRQISVNLNICKAIIDSLHGTIEAKVTDPESGKGSTITFWFPCHVRFN